MGPEQTGEFVGYIMGMIFAPVLLAWVTALITRGIGGLVNRPEWHGWSAGLVVACLGVLGQVVQQNPIGVGGSLLGTLFVWHTARQKSKIAD